MSVFFNLALDYFGHLILLHIAVHPLWLFCAVVTGDVQCSAGVAEWASLVTFLLP